MGEWRETRFGDVLAGSVRNGIYKPKQFHGRGAKIVNMGELFAYPRLRDVEMKRLELTAAEQQRFLLASGDLIFARRSLTSEGAGKCSIVMDVAEPTTFESSIIRARPRPDAASPLFLYYLFAGPSGRHALDTIKREVAVSGITGTDLANLTLRLPPLDEQRAIAAVLSALDDKIELNRRMNETLEASARALFRDWFVDFGPTRAKAEGRPAYLTPDLWSLFPDRLDDDGVPEGWEWSTIGEEIEAVGGSTPSTKDASLWDGAIAWTTPKDLSDLGSPVLLETARTITDAGLQKISSGLLPAGTVLMSSRAPVGYLAIANIPLAINQGYIAMRCEGRVSNWQAYLWAHENMDAIVANANGSTFQEISKKNFRPLPILVAGDAVRAAFDNLVAPMFERIIANVTESRTLAVTRDALLPKLLSGEIRVRNTEALAA